MLKDTPKAFTGCKNTIKSEITYRDNAIKFGLTDKAGEFDKVVMFYAISLETINKGEILKP